MPRWGFSAALDPARTAKAVGRDLRISYKDSVEIGNAIRGLNVDKAKELLEQTIEGSRPIPYKRFHGKIGHRKGKGMGPGRYPKKAGKHFLEIIENAEANAEFKGLDTTRLVVSHVAAHKGMKIKKYIQRAFGRATPYFQQLVHIEIGLEERF